MAYVCYRGRHHLSATGGAPICLLDVALFEKMNQFPAFCLARWFRFFVVVVSSKKCKDKGIDKAKIREPWMIVVPLVKGVREDDERE